MNDPGYFSQEVGDGEFYRDWALEMKLTDANQILLNEVKELKRELKIERLLVDSQDRMIESLKERLIG